MIISHQHKYIFFAVPKTATHAVREALREHKAEQDWEQQMLFGKQRIPIANIAAIEHGHITAREISAVLDQEQWASYFKFAFVRNPFDRFVSACAFLNRGNDQFKQRPTEWMKVAMTRPQFRQRVLIRAQTEQLLNRDGSPAMNFVGRYEVLQASLNELFAHLKLPEHTLAVRNASEHHHYHDYIDADLERQLTQFYAADLAHFNYSF